MDRRSAITIFVIGPLVFLLASFPAGYLSEHHSNNPPLYWLAFGLCILGPAASIIGMVQQIKRVSFIKFILFTVLGVIEYFLVFLLAFFIYISMYGFF